MTGSWQDPKMGAAFHKLHGGSPKHNAVPEMFESGWEAGRIAFAKELAATDPTVIDGSAK
ncbi:hypothetical protein [Frigoribacterium sp. CG_9.8]|uniref:hypothetical protein n=1 Tax=Frigoribacterium sp. CG_9.8 TaxID=2787733 RepID=UPI0018CA77A2|nr:hypothetical protein [Frigoribacterium sp. CG_9.8]MBG6106605.1 hypothetical protein [Frigoribacterium sp. CG_9.8]